MLNLNHFVYNKTALICAIGSVSGLHTLLLRTGYEIMCLRNQNQHQSQKKQMLGITKS